jgi:dihydrofolate reductase
VSRLRVHNFSISLDGYGAGPNQDTGNPLGRGGLALHEWLTRSRTFRRLFEGEDGATGPDDDFVARGFENIGAWILGRNMFGPIRGDWPDDTWRGWWGDSPPYHDEVHIAIAPVTLGSGEHLLHGIDTPGLGYACTEHVTTDHATHFVLTKQR